MTENRKELSQIVLKITLLLGGIPPIISGLGAMFMVDSYISALGPQIPTLYAGSCYQLLAGIFSLQGGDAFVAGFSRVVAAFLGSIQLQRLFALAGIFHSCYEIWLLPHRLVPWANAVPGVAPAFYYQVWGFVILHVVLIIGFASGLFLSYGYQKTESTESGK